MANVNADTAKLEALRSQLYDGRKNFLDLNDNMNERLKNANSFWQDVQYGKFYGKFNQDVYTAIDEMCREINTFETYLERKIGQLERYLETEI